MQTLLGMAVLVVLSLSWGAPAGAVIIASGDGTGNTSAPPDDPGWENVVNLSGLTGVYLGNGWVLTADHVGSRDMIIGSDVYEPVPGSEVQLQTDGSNADLALFQILYDPGLPDVLIRTSPPRDSPPSQASEVVMIGRGRSRGAAISACSSEGWLWVGPSTMRWGTNVVYQNDIDLAIPNRLTRSFSTVFDASLPTAHEAQASTGDSGGAVFVKNGTTWELAGIMTAIATFGDCNDDAALYGNLTYAADLSFYLDQIEEIADVPACDDDIDQDGDGLVDYPEDPGCDDALDPFETSGAPPCDGGLDSDCDGIQDALDNCLDVANGPSAGICYSADVQVDTDGDGYGNPCDGDFNNDSAADAFDCPSPYFFADLGTGIDSGIGSDMNCDGAVDGFDVILFADQLALGAPGP